MQRGVGGINLADERFSRKTTLCDVTFTSFQCVPFWCWYPPRCGAVESTFRNRFQGVPCSMSSSAAYRTVRRYCPVPRKDLPVCMPPPPRICVRGLTLLPPSRTYSNRKKRCAFHTLVHAFYDFCPDELLPNVGIEQLLFSRPLCKKATPSQCSFRPKMLAAAATAGGRYPS